MYGLRLKALSYIPYCFVYSKFRTSLCRLQMLLCYDIVRKYIKTPAKGDGALIRVTFIMLITMLLLIGFMIGSLFLPTDSLLADPPAKAPLYHLQIIVQNTSTHFWKQFCSGADVAGTDLGIYVEFVPLMSLDGDALTEAIEKGINADVDGIALRVTDFENTRTAIEEAIAAGIEVVTFENDEELIPDIPTVGSNSYDIGAVAGQMAVTAGNADATVAVILGSSEGSGDTQYKSLIVQGIADSFSLYSSMTIDDIYTLNAGLFEAEKLTYSLLESNSDIDLIICADEMSTPGVAQVLVDNNKVGDVQVIGYGVMPETLDYIERGVIFGSVCPDAYGIGYSTVKQLLSGLNNDPSSDTTNTDLYTIHAANVSDYRTED